MEINIYEEIIKRFPFPLVIWKTESEQIKCVFTNIIDGLSKGDRFKDYIKQNPYSNRFEEIFNKDEVIIKLEHQVIYLIRICPEAFYELHENVDTDNYHMLSIISHKIRGPLTNIIGILTLLDDMNMNKTQRKYLNIIKKSSLEVVTLANDIVDLMNLSQNRLKLKLAPYGIRHCLDDCVEMATPNAKKKKISLKLDVDDAVPEILVIDCDRMKQIILCLVTNSIKYTDKGSVSVTVEPYKTQHPLSPFKYMKTKSPKYNLLFKVKDTGMGIDPDKAEIMKKMLMIKDSSKLISYKTCGFSLMICRYLIETMGGHIWFETHLDLGTVFYFNIIVDSLDLDD